MTRWKSRARRHSGIRCWPVGRCRIMNRRKCWLCRAARRPTAGGQRSSAGSVSRHDRFATVIHPSARISPLARIGRNVLIMAGVVVTSNAIIGDHVCILPNTVIHHDVVVGDWTLIGSNVSIAGHVRLGRNCYLGSGSRIIDGVEIGERTLIGLGSNVIADVRCDVTVVGNPARPIGPAGEGSRGAARGAVRG